MLMKSSTPEPHCLARSTHILGLLPSGPLEKLLLAAFHRNNFFVWFCMCLCVHVCMHVEARTNLGTIPWMLQTSPSRQHLSLPQSISCRLSYLANNHSPRDPPVSASLGLVLQAHITTLNFTWLRSLCFQGEHFTIQGEAVSPGP